MGIDVPSDAPTRIEVLPAVAFDPLDAQSALDLILSASRNTFRYVVTPNVDHIVRLHADASIVSYYQSAWLSLNDSRALQLLLSLIGVPVPVARGSDLASMLLTTIDRSGARIAVVGCDPCVITELKSKHSRLTILHKNPPMGFYNDEALVSECVDFVRHAEPDFTFFAVGSPQQEMVAYRCLLDRRCQGIGLCIGAALLMHVGQEKRAPALLRATGFEWLFRFAKDPTRLWQRYLVRNPAILLLVAKEGWHRLWRQR